MNDLNIHQNFISARLICLYVIIQSFNYIKIWQVEIYFLLTLYNILSVCW